MATDDPFSPAPISRKLSFTNFCVKYKGSSSFPLRVLASGHCLHLQDNIDQSWSEGTMEHSLSLAGV